MVGGKWKSRARAVPALVVLALLSAGVVFSSCPQRAGRVPGERRVVKLSQSEELRLPGYEILSFQPERLPVLMGLTPKRISLIAKPAVKLFEIYTAVIGEEPARPTLGERDIKVAPTNGGDQYAKNGYALDYALFMERGGKQGSYELILLPMTGFGEPSISLREFMVPDYTMGQHYLISYGGEYLFALSSIPLDGPPSSGEQAGEEVSAEEGEEKSGRVSPPDTDQDPPAQSSSQGENGETPPAQPEGAPEKGGQTVGTYIPDRFRLLYKVVRINRDQEGGLSLEELRSVEIDLPPEAGLGLLAQASAAKDGVVLAFYREEAQNYQVKGTVLARLDLEGNLEILAESEESPALLLAGETTESALLITSGEEAISTHQSLGGRGEERESISSPKVRIMRYDDGEGLREMAELPSPSVSTLAYQKDLSRIFYPSAERGLIELVWRGGSYRERDFPHLITYAPIYWHPDYRALIMELGNAYVMFPERELERYDRFLAERAEVRWNQLQDQLREMGLAELERDSYTVRVEEWRVPPARDWENLLVTPKHPQDPGQLFSPARFSFYRDEDRFFRFTAGQLMGELLGDFVGGFGDGSETRHAAERLIGSLAKSFGFEGKDLKLVYSRGLGKEKDQQRLWFCRMREVQGFEVCDLKVFMLFAPLSAKLYEVKVEPLPIPEGFRILLDEKTARRYMIRFGESYFHRPTNVELEWVMLMGHYPDYDPVLKVPTHPDLDRPNISWHFRMVGVDRDFYIDARTGLVN